MKKTDKKRENTLIKALTEVCDWAQDEVEGFEWLTHQVNFAQFEQSLRITCVFTTEALLGQVRENQQDSALITQITDVLQEEGIALKYPTKQVVFDSEEACSAQNGGNWAQRLSAH